MNIKKKSLIITILSFTNDHDNYGNECYLARELTSSSSSTPFFNSFNPEEISVHVTYLSKLNALSSKKMTRIDKIFS